MKALVPKAGEIVVVTEIPQCSFENGWCKRPGIYDFRLRGGGWANGCTTHYRDHRAEKGLGVGKAQRLITADQVE